jgi:hypothetical protein
MYGLSHLISKASTALASAHVGAKVQQLHVAIAALRQHSIKHKCSLNKGGRAQHLGDPAVYLAQLHQQLAALQLAQAATTGCKNAAEKLCNNLRRRISLTEDRV